MNAERNRHSIRLKGYNLLFPIGHVFCNNMHTRPTAGKYKKGIINLIGSISEVLCNDKG
ncbi:hypothetical protein FACS1894216_16710 [Synergistales bacterium]|nr:hypothetical protein FACS1894216_16710 [Synergistales bacterium]